ncbi:MAG: phosphoribosylformylglycinamidine synthase subunit PurL [Actinomycetota bacterium]|nr:MAG: phosphoribosylformylglycinamidine synthase subunit PurL [Actinomycetota bacterium]
MEMSLHRSLGLTDSEYEMIVGILGRSPNHLELAMYSVMWSEHCSYKSSRVHLGRLPSKGENVLVGPGENAGVIDIGDGIAVAIRMESHNHPSAIEPYQGAATGVGGILRDIFTMGARPIALFDSLRMGPFEDAKNRWIFSGVVSGISGYGNAVGVPTVGGEIVFDKSFSSNPLVNVAAIGILPKDRLVLAKASGVGNLAVLLGSSTGRDGIGGVSVLASSGFDDSSAEKRPSVQVGDPYEEKRLIEACLELLDMKVVVGIQDLGGAGISCATSETAANAGMGMDVYISEIPVREADMEPFEIMTSESQERMLAIVSPASLEQVLAVAKKWEISASVVGVVTDPVVLPSGKSVGILRVYDKPNGELLAEVPAASLADEAPKYRREMSEPPDLQARRSLEAGFQADKSNLENDLKSMLFDPSWIFSQYDHQLFLNTVVKPGQDATLLKAAGPGVGYTGKGIGASADGNSRWCAVDPKGGAAMVVAESALNVALVGAEPACLVDCLNFGNPEHPVVMWQLSEAIDGIALACQALGIPVVGGNVSFYNEVNGADIDPAPVVTTLGVVQTLIRRPPGIGFVKPASLVLVGNTQRNLAGSRWAYQLKNDNSGSLPKLDLEAHRSLLRAMVNLVWNSEEYVVSALHDVSDGGLALALVEMILAGELGVEISKGAISDHVDLFSESPSRVLVATGKPEAVVGHVSGQGLSARVIGEVTGSRLYIPGLVNLSIDELRKTVKENAITRVGS